VLKRLLTDPVEKCKTPHLVSTEDNRISMSAETWLNENNKLDLEISPKMIEISARRSFSTASVDRIRNRASLIKLSSQKECYLSSKHPILAGGNSNGDMYMLRWLAEQNDPSLSSVDCLCVVCEIAALVSRCTWMLQRRFFCIWK
jgi:hypothetical protein